MLAALASIAALLALAGPAASQQPDGTFKSFTTPSGVAPAKPCSPAPSSKWDVHVCQAAANNVQAGCMPQRRFAYGNAAATNVKALSSCSTGPDAMEVLAAELQSQGYHVYIPLNVGHGFRPDGCTKGVPGAYCVTANGRADRIDAFPRTKQAYIDFAQWTVDMMKEEVALQAPAARRAKGFIVATGGLSLGGPLATVATVSSLVFVHDERGDDLRVLPQSLGNGFFSKTVLINPFYSAALQALDYNVNDCHRTSNPSACMNAFIDKLDGLGGSTNVPNGIDIGAGALFHYFVSNFKSVAAWAVDLVMSNLLLNHYINFVKGVTDLLMDLEEIPTLDNLSLLNQTYGWGAACTANTARNFRETVVSP
ncbi:hypothetical protein HK101_001264 [Irineochytrium annulatum]|nr:hypothetical protein HK101_001264 [Irineochytrium annulatum]